MERGINYLNKNSFRAYIPIYKNLDGSFFTTYDFEKNYIPGSLSIYISPDGEDNNDGLTSESPKKTLESAINSNINTIIFLPGIYKSGINFKKGTQLADLNLIGINNVVIDNNGAEPWVITGSIFIKNISFINGNFGSLRTYITDSKSKCTYIQCEFNSSLVDNPKVTQANSLGGIRIQGGTHFLYKCEASYNGYDGFSYHAAPDNPEANSTSPHIAEVECRGFFNGINSSYESNNGSTAHDGAKIVRLNCTFGNCHGGIIADVHIGTKSFNFGCIAFSPVDLGDSYRKYQANYFAGSGCNFYMYGCKSYGAYYDISSSGKAKVYTDINYLNNYIENGDIKIVSM